MTTQLNESHVCLLDNLSTFRKMKAGEIEVNEYIQEIAKIVVSEIVNQHSSLLVGDLSGIKKEEWISITPARLVNYKKQNITLFNFGIEGLSVNQIFPMDGNGRFQAYVYSNWSQSQNPELCSKLEKVFRAIAEPDGFGLSVNNPDPGYWYRKKLPPIDADKFANSQFFSEYLREPFLTVIKWYEAFSEQILALDP